jgi:hypothetical protein
MSESWRLAALDVDGYGLLLLVTRLLIALALGRIVAAVYRRSRPMGDEAESFVVTLVLLTILIAMVTQVIGDNVARAFSLVGALSIVRFRTVVRDTQDTAYVIFAVAIGMAVGANRYVRDIAERWLDWNVLGPMAHQYHDLIAADVKADTRKIYSTEAFESGLDGSLKSFVERRRAFLLAAP